MDSLLLEFGYEGLKLFRDCYLARSLIPNEVFTVKQAKYSSGHVLDTMDYFPPHLTEGFTIFVFGFLHEHLLEEQFSLKSFNCFF